MNRALQTGCNALSSWYFDQSMSDIPLRHLNVALVLGTRLKKGLFLWVICQVCIWGAYNIKVIVHLWNKWVHMYRQGKAFSVHFVLISLLPFRLWSFCVGHGDGQSVACGICAERKARRSVQIQYNEWQFVMETLSREQLAMTKWWPHLWYFS